MNVSTIMTRVKYNLDAYTEDGMKYLNNSYLMHMIDEGVVELRKELKRPVSETDLVCVVGERGVNLPDDFIELIEGMTPRLIQVSDSAAAEGVPFVIINEATLYG